MPETTTSARSDGGEPPPLIPTTLTDYSNISFPLHLLRSQVILPAPNTGKSAVDWLPEFAGCAWIAYGTSSLFVITHCPSPLSPEETEVGPFFQQVIEPSPGKLGEDVNAVAWCPSRPIDGTVAFGLGNSVRLYAPEVEYAARGSLHWRHKVSLFQSFVVEAIEWTGSGDGLITAGTEVVLWKRKENSWQVTYKLSAEFPQCIVSATWSIDGPVAAAAVANSLTYPCTRNNSATSVLSSKENAQVIVCQHDGRSSFIKSGLLHPQPVSMVQWRPFAQPWSKKSRMHSRRDVLLTCCLDGVVRLWSEVDSIRAKKTSKDNDERKSLGRSYHVVAVIEINQSLKSMLAIDTFVSWAADVHSAFHLDDGNPLCYSEICDYNSIGHCEWLVSLGPGQSLTLWAIHCLDDVSPLRSPRVSLWKKYALEDSKERNFGNAAPSQYSPSLPFLIKSVVSRNKAFSPPITCSLLMLSPNNSISWLCLDNIGSENQVSRLSSLPHNEEISSCAVYQVRSPSGHTGAILQISVHPCIHEVELAVSLDSNSCLCFWSTSSMTSICNFGLESLYNPAWKLLDRIVSQDSSNPVVYANLAWVPHVFNGDLFLFMGHEEGIDCFMARITGLNEQFYCSKAFTISFPGHFPRDLCYSIFTKSFTSVFTTSCFNKFRLLAIWTSEFQVLSWEIIMHSDDSSQATCNCILNGGKAIPYDFIFMNTYAGRTYHIKVDLCSSDFPSLNCSPDKITSFAVSSSYFVPSVQQLTDTEVCKTSSPLYDIVTGYSDGTVRMWRFLRPASSTENMDMKSMPWELVGMLTTHEGPVVSVALSNCGTKLAAVCMTDPNHNLVLQIWRSMYLVSGGCFSLEEKICLNEPVITLNWQTLGNGQLLLAICMKNELRIYLQRRIANMIMEEWDKNVEMLNYFCVAVCCTKRIIKGFFWGPKVTLVLVHDKHFSLYSHWSSTEETGSRRSFLDELKEYNSANIAGKMNEDLDECVKPALTINSCTNGKKLSNSKSGEQFGADNGLQLCSFLRVVDSICEPVAVFHPNALLLHLISGKWKRAYLAVQHLVKYLCSHDTSNGSVEENKVGKSHPLAPEISLAEYFERDVPATSNYEGIAWGSDFSNRMFDKLEDNLIHETGGSSLFNSSVSISGPTFKLSETRRYIDIIEKSHDIPSLTDLERTQFLAVVDLLDECINPSCFSTYESFDEPARRFWIAVRFKNLLFGRKVGKLVAPDDLKAETWMIAWAFQSDCQEGLYNSVLSPESSWLEMHNMGVGYWCTNVTHLRQKMEKLARAKYLFKRDPKDCTLLYLALNRLQVLLGLFKISKDEKDKPLVGFLLRNFQEEKNKAAALKNAYVLLGRHQLELAAAFFLLGGDPYSAVTICAKNLGDEQLALVICRLVEGYGGSLERQLISNVLLPNAIDKGDHWLSSIFEWTLGNYLQSYTNLMNSSLDSAIDSMGALKIHVVSFDPSIGQYCSTLASRNSLRSSVGEQMSAVLSKWAILETGNALIRCGLPLEGLECMSLSSLSNLESKDQIGSLIGENNTTWNTSLKMITCGSDNWLLVDVASHLEYNFRLNVAMRYIAKLVGGHPLWQESTLLSSAMPLNRINNHLFNSQLDGFNAKIKTSISILQQMHSLKSSDIINMMLSFANSYELMFLGFKVLREIFSGEHMDDNTHSIDRFDLCSIKLNMFLKACKEICYSVARYVPYLNITGVLPFSSERYQFNQDRCKSSQLYSSYCFLQGLDCLLKHLRYFLKLYSPSIFEAESCFKTLLVLDHLELSLYFAAACSERNLKELTLMVHPVVNYLSGKLSFQEATGGEMQNLLVQTSGAVQHLYESYLRTAPREVRHDGNDLSVVPLEEGRWKLVGASLWKKLHDFSRHQLRMSMTLITEDGKNIKKQIEALPFFSSESLVTGLASIFSVLNKQHTSWIRQKVENGFPFDTLFNLEGSTETSYLPYSLSQGHGVAELTVTESWVFLLGVLSETSINLEETSSNPCKEISRFLLSRQKDFGFWNGIKGDSLTGSEGQNGVNYDVDFTRRTSSSENEALQLVKGQDSSQEMAVDAGIKDWTFFQEASYFDMPKEVYKRSGELIEAICFNCFDEKQVSLATNKQGIISINLDFEGTPRERAKYLWSDYEWPHDGWAGSESTPVPTFVSQGIGLGTRKGAHLGLGGATVGSISLARPGRDLTGGGAFGIPGYAGMGASGLGWGELEDFEFIDPPATSDNIRARTLCSHPSKPLFLVGSRNTHVYLWEFGKDRAIATYGVLPAANVPPPYALASISALRFDRYGQRFSTAAIDGTICTWQLEVGGRSNVHPTESSLCFNNHATDVTYIAASGSTIAATGYNKNNANAIIWDTLAPPTSSQASIICHEGGARSLSVLDNGSGGGLVSPIIITGGKNGDVSLHDFRYIATGRTKRHKHSSLKGSMQDTKIRVAKSGENDNGLLWHIPKAHLGSITRISAIPNTSLFLTGGSDGDVKLWDANKSKLIFHWQKLHEKHTFLQPSSRGFSGVVRAAVTDVQVLSHGFLSCGGDGTVKRVQLIRSP